MVVFSVLTILFFFLAYRFFRDFYLYDRDSLDYKIITPAMLFVGYVLFGINYGPYELMVDLNDRGYRRSGLFTQFLPLLGLILATFPYQVSEFSDNYIEITKARLNSMYRLVGWLMVVTAAVRNFLALA